MEFFFPGKILKSLKNKYRCCIYFFCFSLLLDGDCMCLIKHLIKLFERQNDRLQSFCLLVYFSHAPGGWCWSRAAAGTVTYPRFHTTMAEFPLLLLSLSLLPPDLYITAILHLRAGPRNATQMFECGHLNW